MKILIIRTFPNILNPENYNVQEMGLAKALTRAGYQCGVVLYNGNQKSKVDIVPVWCDGVEKEILVYRLRGFSILKNGFFFSLNKIAKEYDVIQVHEYDQITSWLYYAWSKKNVVIYHGPYYDKFNKGYNIKCKIFDNFFLKIKNDESVPCLTKSTLAKDFLVNKGFKYVTAVGVGLDAENFEKHLKGEYSRIYVEPETYTLVYVGKIEERRNSLFLAEIMKKAAEKYSDIRCIVVGDGNAEYVEQFVERVEGLIKENKLRYYKKATQAQLADLYKQASLMIFPSNYEIFGMVLAEAVYFGLPVISTQNGGADMLIHDEKDGSIVHGFDIDEWLIQIEKYYHKERKMAELNQSILWDEVIKKMIPSYTGNIFL